MKENKVHPGYKPGKNDKGHMVKGMPSQKAGGSQKHQSSAGNWVSCDQGVHGMRSPRPTPAATRGA